MTDWIIRIMVMKKNKLGMKRKETNLMMNIQSISFICSDWITKSSYKLWNGVKKVNVIYK